MLIKCSYKLILISIFLITFSSKETHCMAIYVDATLFILCHSQQDLIIKLSNSPVLLGFSYLYKTKVFGTPSYSGFSLPLKEHLHKRQFIPYKRNTSSTKTTHTIYAI